MDLRETNNGLLVKALIVGFVIAMVVAISSVVSTWQKGNADEQAEETTRNLIAGNDVSSEDLEKIADAVDEATEADATEDDATSFTLSGQLVDNNSTESLATQVANSESNGTTINVTINDNGKWGLKFDRNNFTWTNPNSADRKYSDTNQLMFAFHNSYLLSDASQPAGYKFQIEPGTVYGDNPTDLLSPNTVSSNGSDQRYYEKYKQTFNGSPYQTVLFNYTYKPTGASSEEELAPENTCMGLDYNYKTVNEKLKTLTESGGDLTITPSALAQGIYTDASGYNYTTYYAPYAIDTSNCAYYTTNLSGGTGAQAGVFKLKQNATTGEWEGDVNLSCTKTLEDSSNRPLYRLTATDADDEDNYLVYKYAAADSGYTKAALWVTTYNALGQSISTCYNLEFDGDGKCTTELPTISDSGAYLWFNMYNPNNSGTPFGYVYDASTQNPISNAVVYAYSGASYTTLIGKANTDSYGYFSMNGSGVNYGTSVWYVVEADGYITKEFQAINTSSSIKIYVNSSVSISARVVNDDGDSLEGLTVGVWDVDQGCVLQESVTDEYGRFNLSGLTYGAKVYFYCSDDTDYYVPVKAYTLNESFELLTEALVAKRIYHATLSVDNEWLGKVVALNDDGTAGDRITSLNLYQENSTYKQNDDNTITFNFPELVGKNSYSVTVKPVAAPNAKFSKWTVSVPAADSNEITSDINFVANFGEAQTIIAYGSSKGGSVNNTIDMLDTETTEPLGATATAKSGYTFTCWTNSAGEEVSTEAVFVPTTSEGEYVADTYTANFKDNSQQGGGGGTGGNGGTSSGTTSTVASTSSALTGSTTQTGDVPAYAILCGLMAVVALGCGSACFYIKARKK